MDTTWIDEAYVKAVKAGWKPRQYRIVETRRGHALEKDTIMANGSTQWVEVFWSRSLERAQDAMTRYKNS